MIEKKSFIMAIKRGFETGTFNYVGQEVKEFPHQLWKIDQLSIQDQNWWECNPISKIDVSNNEISIIPQGITTLPDIQVLRMKNNLVKQFPKYLMNFQNLKSVDLNRNKLHSIAPQIMHSKSLVELNFSENLLESCPNLHEISTLEVVYFNNNKLQEIPCLGEGIKKAQFQQNRIREIKREHFHRCTNLEQLNLNKNQIQNVQRNSFANLRNLIILEFKQNRLNSLSELPNSEKLDTLSLSFNRLVEFSYFDRCPNLTVLILSDNKIKSISKDIIKLKKLKTLDLSNNDLPDLPCEIGFINSLVRIQVQGNPLKTMRQNIRTGGTNILKNYLRDRMDPKQRDKLESKTSTSFQKFSDSQYWGKLLYEFTQNGELILRKMGLKQVDESVYDKNLRGINFTENKLQKLSENIGKLQDLKYLIINNNQVQDLPTNLGKIPSLEQIEAKNNQISDFNAGPYDYQSLHFLDLSANRLKYIPKGIIMLPRIRTLYLGYNHITDAQPLWNPKYLTQLEVIDLSNNQLSELSDNVYLRAGLNFLNVENNSLTRIPTILGFMNLSGLKIDGNPLKLIKRTVIQKGSVAILQHLRTKHTGPIPEPQPQKAPPKKPEIVSQKPSYPYETNPIQLPIQPPKQTVDQAKQIKALEKEIKQIQDQLDNNMGMNNMMRNQKKKAMQQLMIKKNKIIKGSQ